MDSILNLNEKRSFNTELSLYIWETVTKISVVITWTDTIAYSW
jgi:hypothetical protein